MHNEMKNLESSFKFSLYQQSIFQNMSYFGLTKHTISKSRSTGFKICNSTATAQSLFYLIIFNSLMKVLYIVYLCVDKFTELDFLDKITVALYFLFFGIMGLSLIGIWSHHDPFYEILHEFWSVEDGIYKRLGCPTHLKDVIDKEQKVTVWIHLAITYVGCACFLVQYYGDPKYYTFAYYLVEEESLLLWIVFGVHEFIFMQHCWFTMIACSCCFTFHAIALSNFIQYMTATANKIFNQMGCARKSKTSTANVTAPGTQYHIGNLLSDYQKLMLITDRYNSYIAYKTVFLHACGYFQFISDVFLAVQVLRLPGTNVLDIWFYAEDSLVSMYMIYRVYKFMSRVETISAKFIHAANLCMEFPIKEKRWIQRTIRTMKRVSLKLGPCPVTPDTVLRAMDMLSGYYICVALWK